MSQDITATTTAADLTAHLDAANIDYTTNPEDTIATGSLRVYRDANCPGWAWSDREETGGLDSFEELDKLVVDALKIGERIIAARGDIDEDTGIVHGFSGHMAYVGFDSGVSLNVPVSDLERA